MVFGIEEIGDEGLCFSLVLKKDQLEIDQAGLNVNVDITVNGSLNRIGDDVYLKGTVMTSVVASCSRCLDTLSYPINSDLKAHFDDDGDLDVVFNNLGSSLGVYRNDAKAPRVAVRLRGRAPNTQGVGAKVGLIGGAQGPDGKPIEQWTEIHVGSGYASGSEALAVFSAKAPLKSGMKIEVVWRSGKRSVLEMVAANNLYTINEESAVPFSPPLPPTDPTCWRSTGMPRASSPWSSVA